MAATASKPGARRQFAWALGLIAAGTLIRLGLLLLDWPATDSDEGTMGLMALHITHGAHPVFFYGQTYMGALQAYLGAALFTLFGASVFTLRLGLLLLFMLFLAVMYALVRRLYDHRFALFSLALLALGGPEILKPQLLALGGYPETLLFGALSLLLALWLAFDARSNRHTRWLRLAAYAAFGATLGLGWWSDPLVLPFLVAATLLLVVCCARDLHWGGLAAVALGLLTGLAPQIAYSLAHPGEMGATAVAAFQPQGVGTLAQLPARLGLQALGTALISFPDITSVGWVCPMALDHAGIPSSGSALGTFACAGLRGGWSLGALALGGIATAVTLQALCGLRATKQSSGESESAPASHAFADGPSPRRGGGRGRGLSLARDWSDDDHRAAVIQFGRLALLVGGGLTLVMYLISPAAIPPGHARYLIGIAIALPAILYPLWVAATVPRLDAKAPRRSWIRQVLVSRLCLGLVLLTLAGGVVATYRQTPATHAQYAADQALARDLERLGIRHLYTDYWTCYKVAFLTREKITCAVLGSSLEPGNNRYPPYVAAVANDPHAAYVFPSDSLQTAALIAKAATPGWRYRQVSLDGYVAYLPT